MTKKELENRVAALDNNQSLQRICNMVRAWNTFKSTGEPEGNYAYLKVNFEQIDYFGLDYISIGCSFFEIKEIEKACTYLCKGAEIIEMIHNIRNVQSPCKSFYGLIAALAFYTGMQYSRAFVLITKIDEDTKIGKLITLFLRRRFSELVSIVEEMVISDDYNDKELAQKEDASDIRNRIFEITIAKALYCFIQYYYTGDYNLISTTRERLQILLSVTREEKIADMWIVVRLLLLILDGFEQSSLWLALGKYFDVLSEDSLARKYILSLVYKKNAVTELFPSQRGALAEVLNFASKGTIVSIPTSSGKTRIAEIAIIKALNQMPCKKVFYFAPFRSLAYAVEDSLGLIFNMANINVTHLYGGGIFSEMDAEEINDANVIIVTPEKAKAIYRCLPKIADDVSLIVMDEGHLLGGDARGIANEIFYEELRMKLAGKNCKCLLLSAVLPNADDLSFWLTGTNDNIYNNQWRPSQQKYGILSWKDKSADIEWYDNPSGPLFNHNFIVSQNLPMQPRQRIPHYYPANKNDVVVETARRFLRFGSVLIIVGRKDSCNKMAETYLAHSNDDKPFIFPQEAETARDIFKLTCKECYGDDSDFYRYAQNGIFCHNAGLYSEARIAMEKLLQLARPRIVIATTTLGQGVNLGVSSVILSTIYQSKTKISKRDFWNIAGRAGRAFVDSEGKVLIIFEYNHNKSSKYNNCIYKQLKSYLDKMNMEPVISGLYFIVGEILKLSQEISMDFSTMLELITENKWNQVSADTKELDVNMERLDDCLLSMQETHGDNEDWIDDAFINSLAFIQSKKNYNKEITPPMILAFVKARIKYIRTKTMNISDKQQLVSSGLLLQESIDLTGKLPDIIALVLGYTQTEENVEDKIALLSNLEAILQNIPSLASKFVNTPDIDEIRHKWLSGIALKDIIAKGEKNDIISKYYAYELPWKLNGIRRMIEESDYTDDKNIPFVLSELALCVETGLPNIHAIKIYRSGIRSRVSALEISNHMNVSFGDKIPSWVVQDIIIRQSSKWNDISQQTKEWIEVLKVIKKKREKPLVHSIPSFSIKDDNLNLNRFKIRMIRGNKYFLSLDLEKCQLMHPSNRDEDFKKIENLKGVYFEKQGEEYKIVCYNPYLNVE